MDELIKKELQQEFILTPEQINFFKINRYIKLKQVFSANTVAFFNKAIGDLVNRMSSVTIKQEKQDTYSKAFLQLFNLWREDELTKELVFSKRLGKIASDLMGTRGVRMYHDQALFKEAGGGFTPWHADQYYWPLNSDQTVTAWIPLQTTPLEMGPLEFSAGSHVIVEGRDLAIGDESEMLIQKKLRVTNFKHVIEPFDLGEISFHSGWIFHRAGANTTTETRKVMTIIYMDSDMKLKMPQNKNQQEDWEKWCPGAIPGQVIDTYLNPILYQR